MSLLGLGIGLAIAGTLTTVGGSVMTGIGEYQDDHKNKDDDDDDDDEEE